MRLYLLINSLINWHPKSFFLFFFILLFIVSLIRFISKPNSSSDVTIFIISFISSFSITDVALPDPNIYLWIAASVAGSAAVNSNGINTLLANGLNTFSIEGDPVFNNSPKCLPRNPIFFLFYKTFYFILFCLVLLKFFIITY